MVRVSLAARTMHKQLQHVLQKRTSFFRKTMMRRSTTNFSTTNKFDDEDHSNLSSLTENVFDPDKWDDPVQIDQFQKELSEYNQRTKTLIGALQQAPLSDAQCEATFGPTYRRAIQVPNPLEDVEQLPSGVPVLMAPQLLERAHWHAQSFPWIHEMSMRSGEESSSSFAEPARFVQRWHGTLRWDLARRQLAQGTLHRGEIVEVPPDFEFAYAQSYPHARSLFANNPKPTVDLHFGSTHVALGFNDLGELLSANYVPGNHDGADQQQQQHPLRFVGYEQSAFSVAKYSVIAEMLRQDKVDNSTAILQVWFSSTWTENTLESFRQACHSVLPALQDDTLASAQAMDSQRTAKVVHYVKDWIRTIPLDADAARRNWFLYHCASGGQDGLLAACDFVTANDRVALLRYSLAGEVVLEDSDSAGSHQKPPTPPENRVGNITFWGGSNKTMDDPILLGDRITTTELTESLLEEKEGCVGMSSDVVQCIIHRKVRQIKRLKELISKGLVEIDLRCGVLGAIANPDSESLALEIQSLDAKTMSWSNLVDYFRTKDFHDLAFELSNQDTRHYGYTMNWPTVTYGADILDYTSRSERCSLLDTCYGECASQTWQSTGQSKLLLHPSLKTPFDLVGYLLASKYHKSWASHFVESSSHTVDLTGCWIGLDSPLLRSPRTVYLTWQYQPEQTTTIFL